MGLSGGRKRVKIAHDPNNTSWSRSTDGFGHRMLLTQGWSPGSTLGAKNADYSKHLTAASHSHIRVAMREDNLGLGAKRGSGQEAGECVGLDAFQAMLGRLNGKSDEALQKEASSREDMKRQRYVERKGMIQFVYGGRLVGDDYDEETEGDESGADQSEDVSKRQQASENATDDGEEPKIKSKKDKTKKDKKSRRAEKRKQLSDSEEGDEIADRAAGQAPADAEDETTRKARRKQEKAEKRERKRLKKEAKSAKSAKKSSDMGSERMDSSTDDVQTEIKETLTIEPVKEASSVSNAVSGRHTSVRSRYIAAKRRAVMDPQALKEILMVKV